VKKRLKDIIMRSSFASKFLRSRQVDCYIISYQCSGRTWLRVLIGKALCEQYHLPEKLFSNIYAVTTAAGIARTKKNHDDTVINKVSTDYRELSEDKSFFKDKKIIFLSRDIKDIVVSSYFHMTKKAKFFEGSMSEFIRSDRFGVKKVLRFYNIWHANREVPADFLHISYEGLKADTAEVLSGTLKFLGAKNVEKRVIDSAVAFASFENMKQMERKKAIRSFEVRPADESDNDTFKVRRGVVGGYKDYLSDEDIRYIDAMVREMGNPFAL